MMISLKSRTGGDTFYLNVDLIEAIIEREGNTSEIRTTNGKLYTSIESPEKISNRVSFMKMSSELSKPRAEQGSHSLSGTCPNCGTFIGIDFAKQ